jgi:hypothetical protein
MRLCPSLALTEKKIGLISLDISIPNTQNKRVYFTFWPIILKHLADHVSPLVRAAVTENSYAPFELLSLLCEDEHPGVRFTMAENPNVPKSLLAKLTIDDNPYVASRACTTLKRLDGGATIWIE